MGLVSRASLSIPSVFSEEIVNYSIQVNSVLYSILNGVVKQNPYPR